jgi:hypothetical protein
MFADMRRGADFDRHPEYSGRNRQAAPRSQGRGSSAGERTTRLKALAAFRYSFDIWEYARNEARNFLLHPDV